MKNKIKFFAFVVTLALTLPLFAQYTPATDTVHKPDMKQDMMSKMGKPTFEATSGDLHFSIWVITQEEHKKMMEGMSEKGMDKDMDMNETKDMTMKKDNTSKKDAGMEMDKATKDAMMAGTHHMMVDVENTTGGNETNATSAQVEIVSPRNKNSAVDLKTHMTNHFGGGLTLDEKGEYQLKVSVLVGKISKTMKFKYTVM